MDTTPRKQTKILTLLEHMEKNQCEIASIVGENQSTVLRLLKQARAIGTLSSNSKEKCGSKRKTSKREDIRLLQESKKDPRKTSGMLRKDLLSSGVNVSSSTVGRRLIECGRMARCNNNNLGNSHAIIPCRRSFSVLVIIYGIPPYTNRCLFILFSKPFYW